MEMMDYLKSPELVYKLQNYFGIKLDKNDNKDDRKYEITNKFWYYTFLFGTELGDELFYSIYIPFWFWNVDGYVGRRVVLVWALVMYIGQALKDIIKWPRPAYPAIRLQNKWALEYGMPSTHAMVGISIPFSVLLFNLNRYQYNVPFGIIIAVVWCTIICISRLYLGMHTVLDIIAGLTIAGGLMVPLVPGVDYLDNYILTSPTSPILLLVSSILLIIYYPNSEKWTPTRADTTMVLSVTVGVQIGAWLNYQSGIMSPAELSPPYAIYWPTYYKMGCIILRTVLGFLGIIISRPILKKVSMSLLCALFRQNTDEIKNSEYNVGNRYKTIIELSCKYMTYGTIGVCIMYTFPHMFRLLNIERTTFYTEI